MDIAVVDDEKAIREHICGLVEEQQPESRIEAYATGGELLASGKRFDIVFLDIQMEGMNGIEAARGLRERREDTVLVFVTGIKDYVFDAFDCLIPHLIDTGNKWYHLSRKSGGDIVNIG